MSLTYRKATLADLNQYLIWANDPLVRSNAIHQEYITLDDHTAWFKNKLQHPQTELFVFEQEGSLVGQIRLDQEPDGFWLIDYSVDPNYRGKGLGTEMMQMIMLQKKLKFRALVKDNNHSSRRVFEKLNFTWIQTITLHHQQFDQYEKG